MKLRYPTKATSVVVPPTWTHQEQYGADDSQDHTDGEEGWHQEDPEDNQDDSKHEHGLTVPPEGLDLVSVGREGLEPPKD
jgi:hypothetical protein